MKAHITLQSIVIALRRYIPRGWAFFLSTLARVVPALQSYPARLASGDVLYVDLREKMCFGYLFNAGIPHEKGAEKILHKVLRQGGVFVDVGANVGYYTRMASRIVGTSGAVLAFEPMPAALRMLRINVADLPNATVFPVALGEADGRAEFFIRDKGDTSSLAFDSRAKKIQIPVSTLDVALGSMARVDMIKIDVEGFEMQVLRGAIRTIKRHKPVIYFELLDVFMRQTGVTFRDFEILLQQLGYRLHWVDHREINESFISAVPTTYVVALPD